MRLTNSYLPQPVWQQVKPAAHRPIISTSSQLLQVQTISVMIHSATTDTMADRVIFKCVSREQGFSETRNGHPNHPEMPHNTFPFQPFHSLLVHTGQDWHADLMTAVCKSRLLRAPEKNPKMPWKGSGQAASAQ